MKDKENFYPLTPQTKQVRKRRRELGESVCVKIIEGKQGLTKGLSKPHEGQDGAGNVGPAGRG